MTPNPSDLVAWLYSVTDPVERAQLCQTVHAQLGDLRKLVTEVRAAAMLDAFEHHGWSCPKLGQALGLTPSRVLVIVTEARVQRENEMRGLG